MIVRLLALLVAVCFVSAAQAQSSISGSACVPNNTTTKLSRHLVGNGTVQHAPNNVGLIVLYCPISPFASAVNSWVLILNYQDSTGTAPAAFVRARLYRIGVFGDAPPTLMSKVTSDSSANTEVNAVASLVTHTFDFNSNTYFVRVELDRSAANQTIIFRAVGVVIE